MYSGDFRSRVSTYDRRRADQNRISNLLFKSHEVKKKFKTGDFSAKKAHSNSKRSLSPHRSHHGGWSADDSNNAGIEPALNSMKQTIDPALFASNTMRGLLGHLHIGASSYLDQQFAAITENFPAFATSANSNITSALSFNKSASLFSGHKKAEKNFTSSSSPSLRLKRSRSSSEANLKPQLNALDLYYSHFSGLQTSGANGMTVLEELIDAAMHICENSRAAGFLQSSRAAVLLSSSGKVYVGCDVRLPSASEAQSISSERAAFLSAIADGATQFEGIVICTDSDLNFPCPDGTTREFMHSFGVFPVILVNDRLEIRQTTTQDLFLVSETSSTNVISNRTDVRTGNYEFPGIFAHDISKWSINDVGRWLRLSNFEDLCATFEANGIDGQLLILLEETYAQEVLGIIHTLKRKKLMKLIDQLKAHQMKLIKNTIVDELDEYLMSVESRRIQLIAKLKANFDKFDDEKIGLLDFCRLSSLLKYMNRDMESDRVNDWLHDLKQKQVSIDFPTFVSKYCDLYVDEDPDIDKKVSKKSKRESGNDFEWQELGDNIDHGHEKSERNAIHEMPENLVDLKVLAELKGIFDRFAVEGVVTATECSQALTEAGVFSRRRDIAQCLRQRKHFGVKRSISFFEFIRAFAALRDPYQSRRRIPENSRSESARQKGLKVGDNVEAKYNSSGDWYIGTVDFVDLHGCVDVIFGDGETLSNLPPTSVRKLPTSDKLDASDLRSEMQTSKVINTSIEKALGHDTLNTQWIIDQTEIPRLADLHDINQSMHREIIQTTTLFIDIQHHPQ